MDLTAVVAPRAPRSAHHETPPQPGVTPVAWRSARERGASALARRNGLGRQACLGRAPLAVAVHLGFQHNTDTCEDASARLVVIDGMRDETFNSVRAKRSGRQSLSRLRSSTRQESGLLAG